MDKETRTFWPFSRRRALKAMLSGAAGSLAVSPEFIWAQDNLAIRKAREYTWEQPKTRPEYVWENIEDVLYHDLSYTNPAVNSAPEIGVFMRRIWVFNRSMEWHRDGLDGCILCYSNQGDLPLTGTRQVSRWHSDPRNSIEDSGESTRFAIASDRRRDCAVLPAFQFHLGQHPRLNLSVSEATGDWQFCVSIKGRSGPPFISSGWRSGPGEFTCDLAAELKKRGYTLNFAELHFVIGTWNQDPAVHSSITYNLAMPARPALVTSLPVIRTSGSAAESGVPVVAAAVDRRGRRVDGQAVKVFAVLAGRKIPMLESGGFWKTSLHGLKPGDYDLNVIAEGSVEDQRTLHLRVTDGRFWTFEKSHGLFAKDHQVSGPLSGSFQGTFFFRDVGSPDERLIHGQSHWDSWDRSVAPGEHLHYWEALTAKELEERFAYLAENGWDCLYLHQHWGLWERLDAGGRIAPYGAEQVALYMRLAARHGLAFMQALSSYPYARDPHPDKPEGTVPYSAYFEGGFRDEDWYVPGDRPFDRMFHQYLSDFTDLFRDDTALLGMTASGEGDHFNGLARSDDIFHYVRAHDKNHLFLAEPVHIMQKMPQEESEGWKQDLLGGRTYAIGDELYPEFDLGVEFKFYQLAGLYMAEGAWPASNLYTRLHLALRTDHGFAQAWAGTPRYRTRIRDSFYLGLVHHIPLLMTWDEAITEDEHAVFRQIRNQVDWTQAFSDAQVAVRVDNSNVRGPGRINLARFEEAFARMPLPYRMIAGDAAAPPGVDTVFDARKPFEPPRFKSGGGTLPDELQEHIPLRVSSGYCASYLWSQDRRTMLSYVYNVTGHAEEAQWLTGKYHRIPKLAPLSIRLQNFPGQKLKYSAYDLNQKAVFRSGSVQQKLELGVGETDRDYFVLVTPA